MKWNTPSVAQSQLEVLLKHKGIGPVGSKSLTTEQLDELGALLQEPTTSLTTQASLFAAFSLLPNQPEEQKWFDNARNHFFAEPLREIHRIDHPLTQLVCRVLQRENLSYDEALVSINYLLDPQCPEFLKGAFLEGQRVKRETHQENLGFLHGLFHRSRRSLTQHPILIDIADNYDGYNRTPCLSPFVAAILGAAGYPTIIHGCEIAAPKMGKTSHQILQRIGYPVMQSLTEALHKLENPQVHWAFIDQSQSFPELFQLHQMRKDMVKRPMLATFEKMLQPLRAANGNLLAMGYTHAAYKDHLSQLIPAYGQAPKALIVRGVEGTARPSLARRTTALWYDGDGIHEEFFDPKEFEIAQTEEETRKEGDAQESLDIGLAVLKGESQNWRPQIEMWAVSLIAGFRLCEDPIAIRKVRDAIDSGRALQHLYNGVKN